MHIQEMAVSVQVFGNATDCSSTDQDAQNANLAYGVSAIFCLLMFLLPTLAFEIYYIWRHKSTFLLRLFFYLSLAAVIVAVSYTLLLGLYFQPQDAVLCYIVDGIIDFVLLVERMLILSINLILLNKVCRYSFGQHIPRSSRGLCWAHQKFWEVVFVAFHFIAPLLITIIRQAVYWSNNPGFCWRMLDYKCFFKHTELLVQIIVFNWIPLAADMILSLFAIAVLSIWFCKNWRVMGGRTRLVCREFGLFYGFLITFAISNWLVSKTIFLIPNIKLSPYYAALFPVSNASLLVSVVVYICVAMSQGSQNESQQVTVNTMNVAATVPPSTRVSLPSDTAAHAPNFLSPSTAEPSEVTPLIN